MSLTLVGALPFAQTTSSSVVDAKGNLRVPENYRTEYQFLGAWAIAAEDGKGSKEMHEVYASPGTIAAYLKAGDFPDGTVLVEEIAIFVIDFNATDRNRWNRRLSRRSLESRLNCLDRETSRSVPRWVGCDHAVCTPR